MASGAQPLASLNGTEQLVVDNGGATIVTCTTEQIAALAAVSGSDTQTAVTATVGTTLTAAALTSGLIGRSGPTANFTDTTDTAAALAAIVPVGGSFYIAIKNLTAFNQTIQGGNGVTISTSPIIPPNSNGTFLFVVTSATVITAYHVDTSPLTTQALEIITALSTVGAGTITGVGIAGGIVSRSGAQTNTAFTDTTDIAANIIAAQPNVHVGAAWEFSYQNTTNATATLQGGTGVTVSGITSVPAGAAARFLVTYTAAATITIVGFMITHPQSVSGTFVSNGVTPVVVANTNITANSVVSFGLKTIGGTPAGSPYMSAVTAGTGFSIKVFAGDSSTYNYLIIN